jgi:hypothetical protein
MDDGQGLRAAFVEPVFLNRLYAAPTIDRLRVLGEYERQFVKGRPGKRMAVLTIIDPHVGREITSEAREFAKQLNSEMDPHTVLMLFIVLGTGFFAAMVRSVIAGIQLFTKRPYTWRVVSDFDDGLRWLPEVLKRHDMSVDEQQLRAAAQRLLDGDGAAAADGVKPA